MSSMPAREHPSGHLYASALSQHPLPTHAVGEVCGQVADDLGGRRPDVVMLFCTGPLVGAMEDIAAAVRSLLQPGILVGASAISIIGNAREVEEAAAVSLWAACWNTGAGPGAVGADPVRLSLRTSGGRATLSGLSNLRDRTGTLVLLGDPSTFPAGAVLEALDGVAPGLKVCGGLASAGTRPRQNRLIVDDAVLVDGGVGVVLDGVVPTQAVVSQGCTPIGSPFTVTAADRNVIFELAGRPAMDRVREVLDRLGPEQRDQAANGLHLGRVIDEHLMEFRRGDFLIRGVLGADQDTGSVNVGDEVQVGQTVQFQVRDAQAAHDDLEDLMEGRRADAALIFTCNGRGERLFGRPHHDAEVVSERLGNIPVAGMFCAGEFGPVGGRSFVHGFTASTVLFGGGAPKEDG